MSDSSTKPVGATSYKDTAFGIIPRKKLLQFEIEGTKKGLEYIKETFGKGKTNKISLRAIPRSLLRSC